MGNSAVGPDPTSEQLALNPQPYGEFLAAKSPGNSRKKMFETLVKKAFSRKFKFIPFFTKYFNKFTVKRLFNQRFKDFFTGISRRFYCHAFPVI